MQSGGCHAAPQETGEESEGAGTFELQKAALPIMRRGRTALRGQPGRIAADGLVMGTRYNGYHRPDNEWHHVFDRGLR